MGADHSRDLSHGADDVFGCMEGRKIERRGQHLYQNPRAQQMSAPATPQNFNDRNSNQQSPPQSNPRISSDYSNNRTPSKQNTNYTTVQNKRFGGEMPAVGVQGHPHLTKYFEMFEKAAHDLDGLTGEELEKKKNEYKFKLQKLAIKSFEHHDGNHNEVLEVQESKAFFYHYVHCYLHFYENFNLATLDRSMKYGLERDVDKGDRKLGQQVLQAQREEALRLYRADEHSRFRAGFSVIDVNSDGRLQEHEVVAMLTPDSEMHEQVHEALGLRLHHPLNRAIGSRHQFDAASMFNHGHGPRHVRDAPPGTRKRGA